MEADRFRDMLKRDGFDEIVLAEMPAHERRDEHAHPYDVTALVLRGTITLTCDGKACTYAVGERFDMAAGKPHAEAVGAQGVQYLVGRRRRAGTE